MNKSKIYLFGLISMVFINFVLIGFLWLGAKHHGPPLHLNGGPKELISKELGFSEMQIEAYEELIKMHRDEIETIEVELSKLKNNYYQTLKTGEAANEAFAKQIGEKQAEIEAVHYKHFLAIKSICTPDQIEKYNEMVGRLDNIFAPKNFKPNHPKHEE